MNFEAIYRTTELNARYADAIDADRLEAWPDFFFDDGCYRITTAENVAQNLPISIIYTTSRAMLRDRVRALREANVYEGQRYRHVLSMPLIIHDGNGSGGDADTVVTGAKPRPMGALVARTSFMVARVMRSGETMLFATGHYEDRIAFDGAKAMFAEKAVILDSRQIDTLLAIPL
jgi:3-phenylpropionate/cinnamic acid dioxygenase small subunit